MPFEPTERLLAGRYSIEKRLGQGGVACVYLARDQRQNTQVAIKHLVLPPELAEYEREHQIQRFLNEGRLMQFLDHPNIMQLWDSFEENGEYYLVMEYLDGLSLEELKSRPSLSQLHWVQVFEQIADALDYAHQRLIVHRDIKPSNVMLVRQDGRVQIKLLDFGIARLETDQRMTTDGSLLGSVAYMSPEQLQNSHNINHQTDLYSLGVLMYEMLSGALPFSADSPAAAIVQIFSQEPVPVMQRKPEIGADLNQIVMICLNKFMEHRFASMGQLRRQLRALRAVMAQAGDAYAAREMYLPRIRPFVEMRLLDAFEALIGRQFTGYCQVWNAFQECRVFFHQGQIHGIEAFGRQIEPFDALCDAICWQAGNFYYRAQDSGPEDSPENSFGLGMDVLLTTLKEVRSEFVGLWQDYQDLDIPEVIQTPSPRDQFGETAKVLLEVLEKNMCIGQLYSLLPFSRPKILTGIKELHDRQFIFITREQSQLSGG